jgi:peptidoglycan hydrolase-like protein with peptidoglycan-binding domain
LQPERVEEIQQALIREGYLQGDASGQWDSRTHDAMQRYQTMHGFPGTGLPEAKSLMKLGLGAHPLPAELDHGPGCFYRVPLIAPDFPGYAAILGIRM